MQLQREPSALDLPDAVLRGNGSSERDDGAQCLLDHTFDARQLVRVAGHEVLMRMTIPCMTVCHRLFDGCVVRETSRDVYRFCQTTVRHRPVGGDLATTCTAKRCAAFVHRRRDSVAHAARVAQSTLPIEYEHV